MAASIPATHPFFSVPSVHKASGGQLSDMTRSPAIARVPDAAGSSDAERAARHRLVNPARTTAISQRIGQSGHSLRVSGARTVMNRLRGLCVRPIRTRIPATGDAATAIHATPRPAPRADAAKTRPRAIRKQPAAMAGALGNRPDEARRSISIPANNGKRLIAASPPTAWSSTCLPLLDQNRISAVTPTIRLRPKVAQQSKSPIRSR